MINTLNVATQGYLPNKTPLSLATLGWLGGLLPPGIFDTEFIWNLSHKNTKWNISTISTDWTLLSIRETWTIKSTNNIWNLNRQKTIWVLQGEE